MHALPFFPLDSQKKNILFIILQKKIILFLIFFIYNGVIF